ncbi:hypothetical protein GCM10023318_58790 [Nocardia callitridis]|uniref:DUF3558 domain-containing protein n=1 Tax=Nocardia callitridis TaxID=648753 RepID=A0ABP9KZG2_9NOCA
MRLVVLALGAALTLSGCGSSTDGDPKAEGSGDNSASQEVAADVPTGYNACTDVPQSVIDSEKWRGGSIPDDSYASGGIKWRGCQWVKGNGYSISIRTTNITVDMVREKNFPNAQELTLGTRKAITTRQIENVQSNCVVNVEMNGGSLELALDNPPASRETGSLDACDLVNDVAEKVTPSIPAAA